MRDADDASLREQLAALDGRIAEQRARIDGFRETHGIVSEARDDNRDAAKLKGLNDSINVAEDEEMRAAGRLAAVQRALEAGEPVSQDKSSLGICVEHLHRLSTLDGDDVVGAGGCATGHVFCQTHIRGHPKRAI